MIPCHRLQSSVSSSRSQACPCTQTKVAQEGVAPSQSWSEFKSKVLSLIESHHMEGQSLFFNLVKVLWNWVVSSKLLVQHIIFRKTSLAFFRSLWSNWLGRWVTVSRSGWGIDKVALSQDQHVVHPGGRARLGNLGKVCQLSVFKYQNVHGTLHQASLYFLDQ